MAIPIGHPVFMRLEMKVPPQVHQYLINKGFEMVPSNPGHYAKLTDPGDGWFDTNWCYSWIEAATMQHLWDTVINP
jgi:hypothetical protein